MAMQHTIHVEHKAGTAQLPRPQRSHQTFAEHRIETRLSRLGDDIQELGEAPYPALLPDRAPVRDAIHELSTKHTTLLWIARVAKCTDGAVRERLWSDIDRALASLELVVDSLMLR